MVQNGEEQEDENHPPGFVSKPKEIIRGTGGEKSGEAKEQQLLSRLLLFVLLLIKIMIMMQDKYNNY